MVNSFNPFEEFRYFMYGFEIIFILISILTFAIIISVIVRAAKRNRVNNYFQQNVTYEKKDYTDVPKKVLSQFGIDEIEDLKKHLYKIFVDFEKAYNSLDYSKLKDLATEDVFNNYHTRMVLESESGKKRIIDGITRRNMIVYDIIAHKYVLEVKTIIEIDYMDYTLDSEGKLIKGDNTKKLTEKFEVIFKKQNYKKTFTNCPNCGAPLEGNTKCKYCNTALRDVTFLIASLKKVIQ